LLDAGDPPGAATVAVRGYDPQILGYLRAVLRDEDAAAEGFSRFAEGLWKGIGGFRGDASALTWAYRVAWGAVCELRRDQPGPAVEGRGDDPGRRRPAAFTDPAVE
jgi:RNA polymerase sigma-70 factor (ECF subfamily)